MIAEETTMALRKQCLNPAVPWALAALISASVLCPPVFAQDSAQQSATNSLPDLPGPSDELLARLSDVYKDIHANPELSMQEKRTAGIAANWLRDRALRSPKA